MLCRDYKIMDRVSLENVKMYLAWSGKQNYTVVFTDFKREHLWEVCLCAWGGGGGLGTEVGGLFF